MKNTLLHILLPLAATLLGAIPSSLAQETAPLITLDSCISRALQSNYSIQIIRNQQRQAQNNVTASPFLPTVALNASQNQTIARGTAETDGTAATQDWARTNALSAGVALNWTLFDGLGMFVTRARYEELLAIGELHTKAAIENLIVRVASAYYEVVRQQHKADAARHSLDLSVARYKEANDKHLLGSLSGIEALQAKLDLNADSSNYMQTREALRAAYITLNTVINGDLHRRDYVRDSILLRPSLAHDPLIDDMLAHNTTLQLARRDRKISALDLKLARAALFPRLNFRGGYNASRNATPSRATTLATSHGPYWGFALSMNLFNRLDTRRRIRNAALDEQNAELSYRDAELQVRSDLEQLYNTYINKLLLVNFEKDNARIAFENLDAALVKYKLGSLAGIEFREFQRTYIDAVDRELSALYDAKISELSLLLISGRILR